MDEPAALLAGDPACVAARRGEAPVERHRRLVGHEGTVFGDPRPERLVLASGAGGDLAVGKLDLDARLAQPGEAAAVRLRVRIAGRRHDAGDSGRDDGVGARRRAALVRARLERDVERRAAGLLARRLERDHLGVRPAGPLVPALADNLAVGDDDRADDRVRMRRSAPTLGELERMLEVVAVAHVTACASPW